MRNWVGGIKGLSLPEFVEEPRRSKGSLTVKVRMTVSQLKELMALVDMSNGDSDSELGRLILQYSCLDHVSKAKPPCTIAAAIIKLMMRNQYYVLQVQGSLLLEM